MSCKRCGASIVLDGTKLSPKATSSSAPPALRDESAAPPAAPPPRIERARASASSPPPTKASASRVPSPSAPSLWEVAEPSGARHEFELEELVRRHALRAFGAGTLVRRRGVGEWRSPYDVPEITEGARPLESARPPSVRPMHMSFNDETVSLGVAESAALSRQAFGSAFDDSSAGEHTPVSSSTAAPLPPPPSSPFQEDEPATIARPWGPPAAQVSLQGPSTTRSAGPPPPPSSSSAAAPPPPPSSRKNPEPLFAEDDEVTRIFDERVLRDRPQHSSSVPTPHAGPATTPVSSPPSAFSLAGGATVPLHERPTEAAPGPSIDSPEWRSQPGRLPVSKVPALPTVGLPGRPSSAPPAPPTFPPPQPQPPAFQPPVPAPLSQPPASPLTGPRAPRSSFPPPPPHAPTASASAAPTARRPSPLTASVPPFLHEPPPRKSFSFGKLLLWLLVIVALGLVGLRLARPDLFGVGLERVQALIVRGSVALGITEPPRVLAEGPPFDTPAAGLVLERAAEQTARCQEPGGPLGRGRVKVLFDPKGNALSAVVSEPFHETPVGRCLVQLFSETRVPPFGGEPVVVSKTFTLR